jgi:hypothetical protein
MSALSKKKDKSKIIFACPSVREIPNAMQCDEARPICKPCLKGNLQCGYELPAGQTRAQASSEIRQRLQGELQAYTALICALRCADSNTSARMLRHLRHGDYDGALLRNDSGSGMASRAEVAYPWDSLPVIDQRHLGLHAHMLPPLKAGIPMRYGSRVYHPSQRTIKIFACSCTQHLGLGELIERRDSGCTSGMCWISATYLPNMSRLNPHLLLPYALGMTR